MTAAATATPALVCNFGLEPTCPITTEMSFSPLPHGFVESHRSMLHERFASRSPGKAHEHKHSKQEEKLCNPQPLLEYDLCLGSAHWQTSIVSSHSLPQKEDPPSK